MTSWSYLTEQQKKMIATSAICFVFIALVALLAHAWINNSVNRKLATEEINRRNALIEQLEKEKAVLNKALAVVRSQIKGEEKELQKLEKTEESQSKDYEFSKKNTDNALSDYNRVRQSRRGGNISANDLCRELDQLGIDCK